MKLRFKKSAQSLATRLLGTENVEKLKFYRAHRCFPDLKTPKTFNEKIVWRKLHDRDPNMQLFVDKYGVKNIVSELVGPDVIIPTLAVYEKVEDVKLDWPMPFVIKCTHASATNIFVQDEADKCGAHAKLKKFMRYDHAFRTNEWAYQIPPRIIIEPMLLVENRRPNDFKLQVFDGRVVAIQVDTERYTSGHRRSYYTPDWERMDLRLTLPWAADIPKPADLEQMIWIAETIGKRFSYARIDLYEGPLFGEVTFYPGAGYERFYPKKWDRFFGDFWALPSSDVEVTAIASKSCCQ